MTRNYTRNQKHVEFEAKVESLRNSGKNNHQIAKELQVSLERIKYVAKNLLAAGRIQRLKFEPTRLNQNDPRLKIIRKQRLACGRSKKKTLQELGEILGVSRQRVMQLEKRINTPPAQTKESLLTVSEAAKKLKVSTTWILRFCTDKTIGTKRGIKYFLNSKDIKFLEKQLDIRCVICGKKVLHNKVGFLLGKKGKTCSKVCKKEKLKQQDKTRRNIMTERSFEPSDYTHKWSNELFAEIKKRGEPANDNWLTVGQAFKISGFSKMQLFWLRRILTTKPHPTETWRKKPISLFAESEVKLAWQIYQKHHVAAS